MKHYDNKAKRTLAAYVSVFFLMVMGIAISGYLSYRNFEQSFRRQAEHQISGIAELKVNELVNWRNERLGDAEFLYHNPVFSAFVQRYFENSGDIEAQTQLLAWLGHFQFYDQYDRVRLLDATGAERLSIPTTPDSLKSHLMQDAIACLRSGKVTFLDFYSDTGAGGEIHLSILVPIFTEQSNNRPLGVLVLRVDPQIYLYPYIQNWPTLSTSAETLLVRRDREDVLFLNELRFEQDAALTLRYPLTDTELPAVKAVLGQTGVVEGVDYRGEPVLADVRAVPDSPWFLVSKMDTAEVYAPLRTRLWQTLGMIGMAIFVAGAAVITVWRQQRILFYRTQAEAVIALRENEEKYRRLFDNAPLGIFQSSPEDKVISINPAFAQMLGYDSPEDAMKSIKNIATDIFADPNRQEEITRLMAVNPDLITFENVYHRKDGSIFIGNLHTIPVRDTNGRLLRVEGIVEDITERKHAEEALNVEQYLMYALMNNVPAHIYFKDRESRFIRINNSEAQSFGLSDPGQAVGKTDFDFFSDEHAQQAYEDEQVIIETGQPISKEEKETWENLPDTWVSTTKLPLRDKDGKIIGTFGLSVDITERKRNEDLLVAERNLLHTLIENLPDSVFVKDVYSRIVVDNIAHRRLLRATAPEQVVGKTDFDFFPKEVAASYYADEQHIIQSGESLINKDEPAVDLDRNQKWLLTTKVPLRDSQGVVTGIVGINHDITERKQAEDALAEERYQMQALMNHMPAHIYFKDRASRFIRIGKSQAVAFDLSDPAQAIGKTDFDFFSDEHAQQAYEDEQAILRTGQPLIKEEKETWTDRPDVWVSTIKLPRRDKDGYIIGTFGISVDITSRKQAEDEIRKLNAELEQRVRDRTVQLEIANKELEAFSYSVSHDLRAPLRGIDGWSQALLEEYGDQLDEQGQQYINRVRSETQRMGHLIDDMLKLSRLTRAEMNKEQVDLSALAHAIVERMQAAEPLRKVDFKIQTGLTAEGDSYLLEAVLVNLLGNAFKFTGKRPDARIEFGQTESQGQRVFFIRDNGAGFDMAYSQKLFGAFQRMHKASEFPGAGIGLATVQRVIHRHGGRVWAEAEVDRGATFYFTLDPLS